MVANYANSSESLILGDVCSTLMIMSSSVPCKVIINS